MSPSQRSWSVTGSTDRPITLQLRLANSGSSFARYPSSVVHTGVKSLGCENSTHQEVPVQSWNLIRPLVVSASKSGARSPIRRDMVHLLQRFSWDELRLQQTLKFSTHAARRSQPRHRNPALLHLGFLNFKMN